MKLPRTSLRRARIEIIPMIDTVFFLLVFFMMASLSMTVHRGMPVSLPRAASGQPAVRRQRGHHGRAGRRALPRSASRWTGGHARGDAAGTRSPARPSWRSSSMPTRPWPTAAWSRCWTSCALAGVAGSPSPSRLGRGRPAMSARFVAWSAVASPSAPTPSASRSASTLSAGWLPHRPRRRCPWRSWPRRLRRLPSPRPRPPRRGRRAPVRRCRRRVWCLRGRPAGSAPHRAAEGDRAGASRAGQPLLAPPSHGHGGSRGASPSPRSPRDFLAARRRPPTGASLLAPAFGRLRRLSWPGPAGRSAGPSLGARIGRDVACRRGPGLPAAGPAEVDRGGAPGAVDSAIGARRSAARSPGMVSARRGRHARGPGRLRRRRWPDHRVRAPARRLPAHAAVSRSRPAPGDPGYGPAPLRGAGHRPRRPGRRRPVGGPPRPRPRCQSTPSASGASSPPATRTPSRSPSG